MRWNRYWAVLVNVHTGMRTPLRFARFRHDWQADDWCHRINKAQLRVQSYPSIEFRYELIP